MLTGNSIEPLPLLPSIAEVNAEAPNPETLAIETPADDALDPLTDLSYQTVTI